MSDRPPDEDVALEVSVSFTEREYAVIDAMLGPQGGGWSKPEDVIKSSLWSMCLHLGIDVPIDFFQVGHSRKKKRSKAMDHNEKHDSTKGQASAAGGGETLVWGSHGADMSKAAGAFAACPADGEPQEGAEVTDCQKTYLDEN